MKMQMQIFLLLNIRQSYTKSRFPFSKTADTFFHFRINNFYASDTTDI